MLSERDGLDGVSNDYILTGNIVTICSSPIKMPFVVVLITWNVSHRDL